MMTPDRCILLPMISRTCTEPVTVDLAAALKKVWVRTGSIQYFFEHTDVPPVSILVCTGETLVIGLSVQDLKNLVEGRLIG